MTAEPTSAPRWRRLRRGAPRATSQPTQAPEDAALAAARRGDLSAWENITRRQQEMVFRTAYLVTRDSTMAEETTRLVFLRAYRSLGSLDDGAPLQPWLMAMAGSIARSHLREMSQRRDAKAPDPDRAPHYPATPFHLLPGAPTPTQVERESLTDAFDGMPDDDRFTIATRYAFYLGRDDAAIRLGVEPDEVEARLGVSMQRLRVRVAEIMARNASLEAVASARARPSPVIDRFASVGDDQLGSMTMAAALSQLPWTPDVATMVCSRLARERLAYPEHRSAVVGSPSGRQSGSTLTSTSDGRRLPARDRGMTSLRAVGLMAGMALVGVSFTAASGAAIGDQRWEVPADVGAGLSAVFGQPAAKTSSGESATSSVVGRPPGSDDADAVAAGAAVAQIPDDAVAPGEAFGAAPIPGVSARAPELSIIGVRRFDDGKLGARVSVGWTSADGSVPVLRTRLERRVGRGKWQASAWSQVQESMVATVRPGKTYRFRIRSIDEAGAEIVSPVTRIVLAARGPRSKELTLLEG